MTQFGPATAPPLGPVKAASVGLVVSADDLDHFAKTAPDLLLLAPGLALSEEEASKHTALPALNLNRFSPEGVITRASTEISPVLIRFVAAIDGCPVEASASQNDVYQYHLRPQYYFARALEIALSAVGAERILIATRPYAWYWSPERPGMGWLHSEERINALLAVRLARRMRLDVTLLTGQSVLKESLDLLLRSMLRHLVFRGYRFVQLVRKTAAAVRDASSRAAFRKWRAIDASPIGILARTHAEVVAARGLVPLLKSAGIPYLFIHDELLSSRTAKTTLAADGEEYVSIGAMKGIAGLFAAYVRAPRRLRWHMPEGGATAALQTITDYRRLWRTLADRLLDFAVDQEQFAVELRTIARATRMRALVSFAYLDQWGQIIKACAGSLGIPAICMQCAAQDPEIYPVLRWADLYCVESLWLKNCLVGFGYPAKDILATGLPHLSGDTGRVLPQAAALEKRRSVGILTQPIYGQYFEQIIEVVGRVCADLGYDMLIKYHPRQRGDEFGEAIAKVRNTVKVRRYRLEALDDCFDQTTVCVSVISATILMSIARGIPLFSLLPIEERHLDLPYVREAVTGAANTPDELESQLRNALGAFDDFYEGYNARRQEYMSRHARYEPTQDIGGNVLAAIRGMTESQPG